MHAVWLHNGVSNLQSGITPNKLLTKTKSDHPYFLWSHVWKWPAYVFGPKLQNYHKFPGWDFHSCLGQVLGFSNEHYSLVANGRSL